MNYKKLNISLGWLVFLLATIVYFLTAEETASLWDCGEYITSAYKLEVGHPPGAPFFMLVGRVFTLFAGSEADIALWVNRMSALSSSLSILFLFWSITMLGKKIALKDSEVMSYGQKIAILGAGAVGALAYTFTESFWFSAVEGEVYAMSSLFTAVIFWAALKWDEEMISIKKGEISPDVRPLRWMILIMFLFGLAIGVHLLGLLALPAIAYLVMYNFRQGKEISTKMFIITGFVGVFILGFIQEGIIPGTIALASRMEIFFVNSLGMPFVSGAIFFFVLLISALVIGLIITRNRDMVIANTVILGLIMLFIGYGSFATIVIRSNAGTPMDQNNPENLVTLHSYLKREQYGSWPILYGEYFNSKVSKDQSTYGDRSPVFDKRYVIVSSTGKEVEAFRNKEKAEEYVEKASKNHSIVHKYFETNKDFRKTQVATYVHNTIFPRMFDRRESHKINGYKSWSGYDQYRKVDRSKIGSDGNPIPTFGDNLTYFISYQVNWMYWRYFMWNFVGRQNDIQGHGDEIRGNWLSGFNMVDQARLGVQNENTPYFTSDNPSNNKFYFIPLILGLIGLFFHFIKAPRDAFVILLLFLFTGLAIVVYLNQKPFEPRERDYAYAASFYAFAIWIGLGVYGLFEAYRSFTKEEYKKLGLVYSALLFLSILADLFGGSNGYAISASTLIIGVIGIGALALMTGLKYIKVKGGIAASTATVLGLIAPLLLGMQGWDDHDRSNRTPARALALNYLESCSPNSILYTNGDNDTFPLWYLQEVEEIRTDVRVANLSLMQTDWYTNQMKKRAYESDPLPIKFEEDQILMHTGGTDMVSFVDLDRINRQDLNSEKIKELTKLKIESNKSAFDRTIRQFRRQLLMACQQMKIEDDGLTNIMSQIIDELSNPVENPDYNTYIITDRISKKLFSDIYNSKLTLDRGVLEQLNTVDDLWKNEWDYLPIDIAMEFVRDDDNIILHETGMKLRIFPSRGFILPVNPENAAKAGIIEVKDIKNCKKEIRFSFARGRMFGKNVSALSREEVMMVDILANFDWKRGIYFSSPGGSDVSKSLFGEDLLQNLGQVYGLSPLKKERKEKDAQEKMYRNIIEVYDYANLAEEGVLVDYYVRRHTSQYRSSFIELAMLYAQDYRKAMNEERNQNQNDSLTSPNSLSKSKEYADKVEEIISHAMDKLPMHKVFDGGEPRGTGSRLSNNKQIYTDGRLTEFISVLYSVEKYDLANKLANDYLSQLETILNFFENSDPRVVSNNEEDFIAFSMNFLRIFREVYTTNQGTKLGERVEKMEQRFTQEVVPQIVRKLEIIEREQDTSSKKRRRSDNKAKRFLELYEALLIENGLMEEKRSE